ncbi:uncharacterized protein LOC123675948 [Harmonia axyridis]|uniref:uncharacterized protein LOC123675948 n=1 Tax=Harmonia axyridis TaxID=115357 RepID=UPI001E276C65|nr:uncharacterized protein LOC123675948 [Harmonia axyridis]XP_045467485.1 uncharacterized protein LOC123675948 [Harmonia axyridis]XP_045467486.1 uncharacterized protein LOC123675948 [Harmonia axyridis]
MNYFNASIVGLFTILLTWICTSANEDEPNDLGRSCRMKTDCPEFGYWCNVNRTCQCLGLYIANKEETRCLGGVRQKCMYDDDCIKNAFCENQTMCRCKKKYHQSDGGLSCIKNSASRSIFPVFLIPTLLILLRIT